MAEVLAPYTEKDVGAYNENVERQRMLNSLSENNFRTDDVHGRLAWNIASQTHSAPYKQDELFSELCNLITKVRNSH